MAFLYELAVLGAPTDDQVNELEHYISTALEPFEMKLGHEVSWAVNPVNFRPQQKRASAAVFFGGKDVTITDLDDLINQSIPVLPVVSDSVKVYDEIPESLRFLNYLAYSDGGTQRVATALLECIGLLPRQRRVFLSYRRDEARQAALQLFDDLSARVFDVFLDTHGIAPAEDFQAMLWHRLCDSDVLVMLDTPNYFESRWTSAEFGRALAKGISVLRIGWPNASPSPRTATASRGDLLDKEVDKVTGQLTQGAVKRICLQLEAVRSQSYAIRNLNLVSNLRNGVEMIGGNVTGVGMHKAVYVQLADGKNVVVYPSVGVPTSTTLHEATTNSPHCSTCSTAVIFDPVGLHPKWLEHLDWLGSQIRSAHWVKANEVAWQFADWEG